MTVLSPRPAKRRDGGLRRRCGTFEGRSADGGRCRRPSDESGR
jgi:hypothetical protein